jgi:uncharacterized membrane protein
VNFNCRAFLWQGGVMTDLNSLIPAGSDVFLIQAHDLNDRGQIVGSALCAGKFRRGSCLLGYAYEQRETGLKQDGDSISRDQTWREDSSASKRSEDAPAAYA